MLARRMGLILPDGAAKAVWDWLIMALIVYNVFTVPLEIAFVLMPGWLEILTEVAFGVDILIHFRTVHYDIDGSLIVSHKAAAHHYLSTWFAVDFIALLPIKHIVYAAQSTWTIEARMCSLNQLLRLFRMRRVARIGGDVVGELLGGARGLHIIRLIFLLASFAHWIACSWWLIGSSYDRPEDVPPVGQLTSASELSQLPSVDGISWVHRCEHAHHACSPSF